MRLPELASRTRRRSAGSWLRWLVVLLPTCTMEGTTEPPLPVDHFDPNEALSAVRDFAGSGARLLSIEAKLVKSSGHLDLTADYHPRLRYEFIRPRSDAETGPVGTGTANRQYEKIRVLVTQPSWRRVTSYGGGCDNPSGNFKHQGMQRDVSLVGKRDALATTEPPVCSMAQVWRQAIRSSDAPSDAVAEIDYSGAGYRFRIRDLDVELYFTADCSPLTEDEFGDASDDLRRTPEQKAERAADEARRTQRRAEREARRLERREQMRKKAGLPTEQK